jgi:spore coat polysaccharide biosynthesis protein SpsF
LKKEQEMLKREGQTINGDYRKSDGSKSVVAFLQARMGSSRLRGKVLMPIRGRSILEHAIRRLRAAPIIDAVAVLTTRLDQDDAIVKEARRLGAWIYRGPESDVLARYYEASVKFRPDIIIRATADNPLIEIGSVCRIVSTLHSENLDFCMERDLPYGAATEAFTAETLSKVHSLAQSLSHREHVTLYIKENPEVFSTSFPLAPPGLRCPDVRVTIDTEEDFVFVDQLIRRLPEGEQPIPLSEYLPFAMGGKEKGECKALGEL